MRLLLKFPNFLFVFFLSAVLLNCASQDRAADMEKKPEIETAQANLTKAQAEDRFKQVQNVNYRLAFNLSETEDSFSGQSILNFKVNHLASPLRIDFYDGTVTSVEVNGKNVPVQYNGKYLLISPKDLVLGTNEVITQFTAKYSREGRGLSRFKDPEDEKIYVHTQLEPYNANYVFPCFDQPDLKATYQMEVVAPQDWIVVSSVREVEVQEKGESRVWKFPTSERFSTYIWSLHAGPYKVWEKNFRIPLRLMARQSLAKYVKTEEWFDVTQQGLDFYEKYFGYKYPFKKYDQLIVPEFTSGAMENVAAVTFNERYVSRGEKSIREKRMLADVILHEMAHMWFGDLVTMKWWNDLWLNESFATYMSHLAMTSNTRFKEGWRDFYGNKMGAYWADELVTTHPIEGMAIDTMHAMANFDGITYGKGASVLKQTSFYISPEKFQKGVQIYFQKHAFQNTRLDDFMGALTEASGKDLNEWKKMWLQTAGVNQIEAKFTCENGSVSEMTLTQAPPSDHPQFRTQRVQVALLAQNKDELKVVKVIPIEINGALTTVAGAKGQPCPAMVYPNYEDYGYMSAILDPVSLKTFSANPQAVKDAFLRQMIWKSLWDLARDAKMPLQDYLTVAVENGLAFEHDDFILRDIFYNLYGQSPLSASAMYYLNRGSKEAFNKQAHHNEEVIWQRLSKAAPGSEEQKVLFDGFKRSVRTPFGQEKILSLLKKKISLPGYVIDQDRRWDMIEILSVTNHPQAKALIAGEQKSDKSFFGLEGAIASRAALPDWSEKKKWIEEFKAEKPAHSMELIGTALHSVFPYTQESLREKYAADFFKDLAAVNKSKDSSVAGSFVQLAPIDCGPGKTDRIGPFLQEHTELQPTISKRLKIQKQENERCQKVISLL
jgi:aminopeptidase N